MAARDSELALAPGLSNVSHAMRSGSSSSDHWRVCAALAMVFIDVSLGAAGPQPVTWKSQTSGR